MNFQYKFNTKGAKPLRMLVKVRAGSTQTLDPGDAVVLSGGNFVRLEADQSMSAVLAIMDHKITASHLAGYYPALIPQEGDVFEADLAAAAAAARGDGLYLTDSTQDLATSGSNVLGNVFDTAGYPKQQGNADVGDVADRGTTVASVGKVLLTIKKAASYFAALQT